MKANMLYCIHRSKRGEKMKLDKAQRRDKKYRKSRYGMRISGKSVFVIVEAMVNRSEESKKKKGK